MANAHHYTRKPKGRRSDGDPLTRRTEPIRLMLRPGEYDDLGTIAEAWDVPIASAGWAIVADYLARLRGGRGDLAEVGIQAALAIGIGRPRMGRPVVRVPAGVDRGEHQDDRDGGELAERPSTSTE